MGGFYG